MDKASLNFLLMGKTGHGKSATGNSLLDRNVFKSSYSSTSVTKKVEFSFAQIDNYEVKVVVLPGLADVDLSTAQAKEAAVENINTAVAICEGGFDAILLVFKFGTRLTEEYTTALDSLKLLFGNGYLDHTIVIVTGRDVFERELCDFDFHDWCRNQTALRQLYDDCRGRFVLVNNKEKDKVKIQKQRQEIIQTAHCLETTQGRYSAENFDRAKTALHMIGIKLKAIPLSEGTQEKMNLLTADKETLPETSSDNDREEILNRIQDLNNKVESRDTGSGLLKALQVPVEQVERNYNCRDMHVSEGFP